MGQVWHAEVRIFQRHTWVEGATRGKEEKKLRVAASFSLGLSLPQSCNPPPKSSKQGNFYPLEFPSFPVTLCLHPTYGTK